MFWTSCPYFYMFTVRLGSVEKHYHGSVLFCFVFIFLFFYIFLLEMRFNKANPLLVDFVHCLRNLETSFFIATFIINGSYGTTYYIIFSNRFLIFNKIYYCIFNNKFFYF